MMTDINSDSPVPKGTIVERENLISSAPAKRTGFTPRPLEKLTRTHLPRSNTNIECSHFLRTSGDEATHGNKSLPYLLWLEAGKHNPPVPQRPDTQYNANIWRNFRKSYGFYTKSDGQKINEMIANMYPMNIPAPSNVGDYTYAKFLRETPLIQDEKRRSYAIDRTARDIEEFKRLRLRADMRNPPMDKSGNIVPPINFKHYTHRFIPPENVSSEDLGPSSAKSQDQTRIDVFGQEVPRAKNSNPYLWKLTYKLNHPQYVKVKEDMVKKKMLPRQHEPYYITSGKVF